ncbi:MAG: hypothetical protein H6834_04955 [Planctomycetes bacterium]|nr:hypothetical protein [Planctomycetota bacterium]
MWRSVSRLLLRGALSMTVLCGLILALEGTLRIVGFAPEGEEARRLRIARTLIEDTRSFEPHARRLYTLSSNYRHSSEHAGRYARGPWAFRGRPLEPSSTDRVRIAVVGDSCVYGTGVDVADTLPYRIERELLERGFDESRVEVVNFGVPGYSTVQIHELLVEVLDTWSPRVVVLYAGAWNDQTPALGMTDRMLRNGRPRSVLQDVLDHTAIHRAMTRLVRPKSSISATVALERFRNGEPPLGYRVSTQELGDEMRAMMRVCRAHGVALQVVVPAHPKDTLIYHPRTGSDAESIRAIAREEGVDTLDAPRLFHALEDAGESSFTDFVHLSPDGTSLLARHAADWIARHLGTPLATHWAESLQIESFEPRSLSAFGDEDVSFTLLGRASSDPAPTVLVGGAPLLDVRVDPGGRVHGRTMANRGGLRDVVVLTERGVTVARRVIDVRPAELSARAAEGLHVQLHARPGDRAVVYVARRRRDRPSWSHHGASFLDMEKAVRLTGSLRADDVGREYDEVEVTGEELFVQALVVPHGEPEGSPLARWSALVTLRW